MKTPAALLLTLFLSALLSSSLSCKIKGKCNGFCKKQMPGAVRPTPCNLTCGDIKCEQNCNGREVCTGRAACVKRCAFKRNRACTITAVRCWCIIVGSCNKKCDCKGPSYFPWTRVKFTLFAASKTGE